MHVRGHFSSLTVPLPHPPFLFHFYVPFFAAVFFHALACSIFISVIFFTSPTPLFSRCIVSFFSEYLPFQIVLARCFRHAHSPACRAHCASRQRRRCRRRSCPQPSSILSFVSALILFRATIPSPLRPPTHPYLPECLPSPPVLFFMFLLFAKRRRQSAAGKSAHDIAAWLVVPLCRVRSP